MQTGLRTAQDERVDIVGAFISVDGFQVHHVADHAIFVRHAIAAMHVARDPGDIESLAAIVALHQRDQFGRCPVFVKQAAETQAPLKAKRDLGFHVGKLLLDQLGGGQRLSELLAIERILARSMPAEFGSTHGAPGNAVTGAVEAAERAGQTGHMRQKIFFRHEHVLHLDHAGGRCPERELALDLRRLEALHAALKHKTLDLAVMGIRFRPDHGHIRDR